MGNRYAPAQMMLVLRICCADAARCFGYLCLLQPPSLLPPLLTPTPRAPCLQAFVGTMFLLTACWQNNQYQLSKGKDHTGAGVPPEIQKVGQPLLLLLLLLLAPPPFAWYIEAPYPVNG